MAVSMGSQPLSRTSAHPLATTAYGPASRFTMLKAGSPLEAARQAAVRAELHRFHPCSSNDVHAARRRSHRTSAASAASSDGEPSALTSITSQRRESWDQITNRLVSSASIPFSILVLPQVVQNMAYMAAGNMSALSAISWEGYLSGLLGNTLMCSHFASSGERSAVFVQLIGIANSFAILLQVTLASCMPQPVFLGVTACVMLAVSMSVAKLTGRISAAPAPGTGQLGTWKTWQLVSGVVGLAVVPQVLYNTVFPGTSNYLPGAVALLALTLWYAVPSHRTSGVEQLPGWASTLLFALSPVPQLVRNILEPSGLAGLSVGTMVLALLGNSLMVPRALFVRDPIWMLGSCWACIAGWGQLLSMFVRASPVTGLRYVDPPVFIAVTIAMVSYFSFVLLRNGQAHSKSN